jgi:multiple sugar transport system permease protein
MFFLVVLLLLPIINVFITSMHSTNLLTPNLNKFVGLENFITAINDPEFWGSVKNGLVWTIGSVFGEFVVGLITAVLLNQNIKGRAIFRAIMITPWVVPIVVAAMTWSWILNPDFGILNAMLEKIGLIHNGINWLGSEQTAMLSVINVNIWRSFPFWTLSFLAVLQTVNKSELEAAEIDGANMFQRFWYITFPKLKGIAFILIVLHLIWTFNNFDFIWILTQGGPLHHTETLAITTYLQAFTQYHFGQASAIAVIMMIILVLLIGIYFFIVKKQSEKRAV